MWNNNASGVGYFELDVNGILTVGIQPGSIPGFPMAGFQLAGGGSRVGISDCSVVCRLIGTTP